MKPNYEASYHKCICAACPSYNDCCQKSGERAFCANEKCSCSIEKKSCRCASCSVYIENNLSGSYFCIDERGY